MYDLVYKQMIAAEIAVCLSEDEQYQVSEDGENVDSNTYSATKTKVRITNPEWLLFSDDVGANISQKDGVNVDDQLFVTIIVTREILRAAIRMGRSC